VKYKEKYKDRNRDVASGGQQINKFFSLEMAFSLSILLTFVIYNKLSVQMSNYRCFTLFEIEISPSFLYASCSKTFSFVALRRTA